MTSLTSGEVTAIVTVIGTVLSFLGITGIDSGVISQAVDGVIAFVSIVAAIWTYYKHTAVVNAQ